MADHGSPDETYRILMGDFLEEAQPLAERLAEAFLEIERLWGDGATAEDLLPGVKSDLHTLKGNSGLMGLTPIQSLTHAMEDLCALAPDCPEMRNDDLAALLLEGGDLLVEMVNQAPAGELADDYCAPLLAKLDAWIRTARPDEDAGESVAEPAAQRSGERGRDRAAGPSGDTVRVDFRKLDGLLEMVGEAMVSQSMLEEAQRRIWPADADSAVATRLDRAMQTLETSLKRLQEGLVETRLLPVSRVFRRFSRSVRDLAREEGKAVALSTEGGDTTIDKTIIDRLGEPLLHLVRNAIAHGVEAPEDRERSGKPVEATVELRAEQLSDRVAISVRDDGRGLDEDRVAERARQIGYDTERLSRSELHALVFQPGFSTADGVSTLSGRGVGLDVVASTIEALGGSISVRSEPGAGTTFRMDLPLTLAVVRALFVEVAGETYALPLSYVEESFRIDEDAVHDVDGRRTLSWRNEMIPVVDAGRLLGAGGDGRGGFCVVITAGARRCGFLVSRLRGHQDVVVKGLEKSIDAQDLLSGVTIMGDGRVVFILDAARITGGTFGAVRSVREHRFARGDTATA